MTHSPLPRIFTLDLGSLLKSKKWSLLNDLLTKLACLPHVKVVKVVEVNFFVLNCFFYSEAINDLCQFICVYCDRIRAIDLIQK